MPGKGKSREKPLREALRWHESYDLCLARAPIQPTPDVELELTFKGRDAQVDLKGGPKAINVCLSKMIERRFEAVLRRENVAICRKVNEMRCPSLILN